MNVKIMSFLAVAVMVLASVGTLAAAEQSQAAPDADETHAQEALVLTNGGSNTRLYQVNEKQFEGYVYTMTWCIVKNDSNTNPSEITNGWQSLGSSSNTIANSSGSFSANTNVAVEGLSVSMAQNAIGKYTLTVGSGTVTSGIDLTLRCEMTITVDGQPITLSKVYYTFKVIIIEEATLVFDNLGLKVGELCGGLISEKSGMVTDISRYYWYAVGLPEGISMSDSGYISGVPLAETGSNITAKIVATNRETGETYTGDLTISVGPAEGTLTSYDFKVSVNGSEKNGPNFYAVQGEDVVLTTYSDSSGQTPANATTVTVVRDDGTVAELNSTSTGTYSLPTNGTGAYRVVMTFGSGEATQSDEFYLFVSPSLNDISAGITITGN